jgi:hypothetical protein
VFYYVVHMSININSNWVSGNKRETNYFETFVRMPKKASGASKWVQLVRKPLKLFNHIYKKTATSTTVDVEKRLGAGVEVLNVFRSPGLTLDAANAIAKVDDLDGMSLPRKISRTVSTIFDTLGTYCSALLFVKPISTIPHLSFALGLTGDMVDLPVDVSDWKEAGRLESQANGDVKAALAHSRKYYLLSLIKDVISIATAIFGLALLPSMPVTGMILISIAGTALGIARDLLDSGGAYPVISFDRGVRIS